MCEIRQLPSLNHSLYSTMKLYLALRCTGTTFAAFVIRSLSVFVQTAWLACRICLPPRMHMCLLKQTLFY